jgi:hypothetical protein
VTALHASAQDVRLSALQAWPHHPRLGQPQGLGLEFGVPLYWRIGLRVGYEQSGDDFDSFDSTCVGLVSPTDDCADELRNEEARLRAFAVGVPVAVLTSDWLRLSLVPGFRTLKVESDLVGTRTGRRLSAGERFSGLQLGADAVFAPVQRWPLRLHLAYYVAQLDGDPAVVVDGYNAFQRTINFDVVQLGVSLALKR